MQDTNSEKVPTYRGVIRVVRHQEVCQILSISSAKLFDMIAKGQFPPSFTLIPNGRAKGWLLSDVELWIQERRDAVSTVKADGNGVKKISKAPTQHAESSDALDEKSLPEHPE